MLTKCNVLDGLPR